LTQLSPAFTGDFQWRHRILLTMLSPEEAGLQAHVHGTANTGDTEAPITVKAYLICAFAAVGGLFFGYDSGWSGGVLAMPFFVRLYTGNPYPWTLFGDDTTSNAYKDYVNRKFVIKASQQSLFTSILSAGTFVGAIIAGDVADYLGRRPTIILGCGIFSVGAICEIVSTALPLMVAGRFIAGLGVGFISAIIILYVSEIAPRKVRGAMVSGYQFCICVGVLLANCVVYATKDRDDTGSYRIPIGIQFLWSTILASGLFFLPESPRFFVRKGQISNAAKALSRIRSQPVESAYVQNELAEIIANYEYEKLVTPQTTYAKSWTSCFTGSILDGSSNLRRTLLGILMQMMQQLTGINFIAYFGTVFFTSLRTISNPFLITLVITLVNTCATPLSFWTIEKFGRRRILLLGAIGMIVSQFLVAIIGSTVGQAKNGNHAAVSAMIAFICLSIASFATTWGPAAWVVVGEIFPLTIRSRGIGLSTASNWFWNCVRLYTLFTPHDFSCTC
jgi:sugar porter (SP) family MFS transporter